MTDDAGLRAALLARVDAYLDAAPRPSTDPVDVGPLRAFLTRAPWPYYARPRPDRDLSGPAAVRVSDLAAAAEVLAGHGQEVAFEWVHERVPSFADAAAEAGYDVTLHPLLLLGGGPAGPGLRPAPAPDGVRLRVLAPDDDALPAARVAADVAFGHEGTASGPAGPADRDEALAGRDPEVDEHVRRRIAAGLSIVVAAETDEGVVGSGGVQPVDAAAEVVGVGVLPSHRRRGVAAAVTSLLVEQATAAGCDLVLLSAADDAVARVYERVGFVRIGHAGAAAPAP